MTLAFFDCFSGISGDMTLGALVDAGLSVRKLREELKKLPLDGYKITTSRVRRAGLAAVKLTVKADKAARKGHRHYADIVRLIEKSRIAAEARERALRVFDALAEAEAWAHGTPREKVHFHEVGAVDSIVDIAGAAIGLVELGIDEVAASPVNTGSGMTETEHGAMPIPAPATARLLAGVPTFAEGPSIELATPTGAAILKALASSFGPRPAMTTRAAGHGAGDHDFPRWPNVLRVFIGERAVGAPRGERLVELWANIDDMSPQVYPVVFDLLFGAGALDAAVIPATMKKGRPGSMLMALCEPSRAAALEEIILANTTTLGIRRREVERVSLPRRVVKVKTKYGAIEVKVAEAPGGAPRPAPEFESVKKAAQAKKVPFDTVYRAALAAFESSGR